MKMNDLATPGEALSRVYLILPGDPWDAVAPYTAPPALIGSMVDANGRIEKRIGSDETGVMRPYAVLRVDDVTPRLHHT